VNDDERDRLATLFRSGSEHSTVRDDCPGAERIWDALRMELPPVERAEIVDHLAGCPTCAEAWRLAMELGSAKGAVTAPKAPSWSLAVLAAAAVLVLAAGAAILWRQAPVAVGPDPQAATPPPPVVVALQDGNRRVTLDAEGKVEAVVALSGDMQARVRRALTTSQLDVPRSQLAALRSTAAPLMGPRTAGFDVVAPVATHVVSDRPTFVWHPLSEARGYQVTVSDVAENYREVATSPEQHTTVWTVQTPLARGRIYAWQVVARTSAGEMKAPGPEAAEARFRVLAQHDADAVQRATQAYAGSHLLLGLTYAEAGVLDRAETELQALADANPSSKPARELLRAVAREGRHQP
jgi:hypothetical protein